MPSSLHSTRMASTTKDPQPSEPVKFNDMPSSVLQNGGQEPLARVAARRLQRIATKDISPELREKVSLAVLDYLGAVASGLQSPWAPQVCQYARSRRGATEAHAWGLQKNVSAETAAFVNATLAHSAIRDDMHLKSNSHIGSIVISASVALAQRDQWSGNQLLRAIIAGYDLAATLGVAVQQSKGYNRHARPSGIIGAFGSAAAAAVAIDATEDVAVNALCFAANMSSGFNEWAWAGGTEIYTEMGTAAQSGIVAFDLAQAGMTCSLTLLEGRAGMFAALGASQGKELFSKGLEAELGQGLMDVRFKPVPGCNYAQTPLAAALRLAQKNELSAGIENIQVNCTSGAKDYPGCDNPGPFSSVQQTKMSIQFGVSAVLLHGEVSEDLFKKYGSKEIEALAAGCKVEAVVEFAESFDEGRQPARIEVHLSDGTTVKEELPDVPWLGADAVRERFQDEMTCLYPDQATREKLANTIESLGNLEDCTDLCKTFSEAVPLASSQ